MSFKKWNLEYQKILTYYKMLIAMGYKELVINSINALLNTKIIEDIDLTSKMQNLRNIKSNLEVSLNNDISTASKKITF